MLPVEIWLKIGSDCGLTSGQLNSLSRSCRYLCTILRPVLYKDLHLDHALSGESALATLHLLSRKSPFRLQYGAGRGNNDGRAYWAVEGRGLSRYVRNFDLPEFSSYGDGLTQALYSATWTSLQYMIALEDLMLFEPPFNDSEGLVQFLVALKSLAGCLRWFWVLGSGRWCGYLLVPDDIQIRGLTGMACSVEESGGPMYRAFHSSYHFPYII
jgi:hypothetical protein